MQEIGRAGRDGIQSNAVLLFNANDIACNRKHLKDEVRDYCKLKSCRRAFICSHFGFIAQETKLAHDCCDICEKICDCNLCFKKIVTEVDEKVEKCVSLVNENQCSERMSHYKNMAQKALVAYFKQENSHCTFTMSEIYTGLTEKLSEEIADKVLSINGEEDVKLLFPAVSPVYIADIYAIIKHIKDTN